MSHKPHNESYRDRTVEVEPEPETTKPSKLSRVKSAAFTAGIFVIPVAVSVAGMAVGYKTSSMQFEAAKLNLEAAKIGRDLAAAAKNAAA